MPSGTGTAAMPASTSSWNSRPKGPRDAVDLTIRVRDEGQGFDPSTVADPLAPENLLKSSGRGIFLIRSFMDDVQLVNAPEGGMEMRMHKRVKSRA